MFFLGTPTENVSGSSFVDINDSGQAIFSLPVAVGGFMGITQHAFVTDSNNTLIDLGTLDGFGNSYATAINNNGQITGYSSVSGPGDHAFVTDSNNTLIDLGTIETGGSSKGYDINESGQVVGGSERVRTNSTLYAFVTDSNFNMKSLKPFPESSTGIRNSASFINNSGLVAGNDNGGYVIDSNGKLTKIPGRIVAINDHDQVVGNSNNIYDGGYSHAYVTNSSFETIDLGTLGGLQSTSSAINNKGHVVGYSEINRLNTNARAFITDSDNNMIELSSLVDNLSNNWEYLSIATDISDTGYIVGSGMTINGESHYYLLTPIALAPPAITYSWNVDSWGGCTGSCGTNNGTRYRTVYCKSSTGDQVADLSCSELKPVTSELCKTEMCPVKPDSPEVSVLKNGLNVTFKWNSTNGTTGYKLYYAPSPYTGPESISFVDVGNTYDFSIDLWEGAAYYVAIRSYNLAGESDYSNIEQFSLR